MSEPLMRFDIAQHPTKDTIKMLTSLLEKVTQANDRRHAASSNSGDPDQSACQVGARSLSHPSPYTCFHARTIPSISIHAYLSRILKYCPCTNECFLALLVYFDRMSKAPGPGKEAQPLLIDSFNIHRLIISGVMIASKLFSDIFFTNTRYAKVGGLPVAELNALELEFISLNNFSLFITTDELQTYADQLALHWWREHHGGTDVSLPSQPTVFQEQSQRSIIQYNDIPSDVVVKVARRLSYDADGTNTADSGHQASQHEHDMSRQRSSKRPTFESSTSSCPGQPKEQQRHQLPTPPDSSSPSNSVISPSPSTSHDLLRHHPNHSHKGPNLLINSQLPQLLSDDATR